MLCRLEATAAEQKAERVMKTHSTEQQSGETYVLSNRSDEGRTDLKIFVLPDTLQTVTTLFTMLYFTVDSSLSSCNVLLSTQTQLSARLCSLALYDIYPHLPNCSVTISLDPFLRLKENPWPPP